MSLRPHLFAPHERLTYQQHQLIECYQLSSQPVGALARALGVAHQALAMELRGVRLMPVARQVALWYLLEGQK